jgi:hypothetical protein
MSAYCCVKLDLFINIKINTFMCRLSWNLGASTSWNPQGLSGTVMGLLYLYMEIWLLTFFTWLRDRDGWSDSRRGRFLSGDNRPEIHWILDWVEHRAVFVAWKRDKSFSLPGIEARFLEIFNIKRYWSGVYYFYFIITNLKRIMWITSARNFVGLYILRKPRTNKNKHDRQGSCILKMRLLRVATVSVGKQ